MEKIDFSKLGKGAKLCYKYRMRNSQLDTHVTVSHATASCRRPGKKVRIVISRETTYNYARS